MADSPSLDENSLTPSWVIVPNPQGPSKFIARPSAYKGSKSLQLSAKRVSEKIASLFSFIIPEEVNGGSLRLKLYVNTLNPQTDSPNIIQVGYRTIVEKNESAIYETRLEENGNTIVYSLSGIKQNRLLKGINIVRLPNGSLTKNITR